MFNEKSICEGCKQEVRNIWQHRQECMMWHMRKVIDKKNKRKKKKRV